ncbi:MAG: hypothetical protein JSS02_19585 [Planctomycetes bacterium]|nr:hypothetical protein [Planctomycetota bacterium]
MRQFSCFWVAMTCYAVAFAGEALFVAPGSFVVFPVSTDLQRLNLQAAPAEVAKVRAFVAINGDPLVDNEGKINANALPVNQLRAALGKVGNREDGLVYITVFLDAKKADRRANQLFQSALVELAKTAGFASAKVLFNVTNDEFDWAKRVLTTEKPGAKEAKELAVGNENVQVYPVQTELSELLTDHADCLVDIQAKYAEATPEVLSSELREQIVDYTSKIKFARKGRVVFFMDSIRDEKRLRAFFDTELKELVKKMGFEKSSVRFR